MTEFQFGDRVVHHARPEWGTGVVTAAQRAAHEGRPCQRLTVRFERAGLKNVSTGVADIRAAGEDPPGAGDAPAPSIEVSAQDWLESLERERKTPQGVFEALPEACADPFSGVADRLRATLGLFRFTRDGASLLDWAAMQTGLRDPLAVFTRHQLEEYFDRFAHARSRHLKELLRGAPADDPAIRAALAKAPADASDLVRRFHASR